MNTLTQTLEWQRERFTEWLDGKGAGKPGKDCYTQLAKYEDLGKTPEELHQILLDKDLFLLRNTFDVYAEMVLYVHDANEYRVMEIHTEDLDKQIDRFQRAADESGKSNFVYLDRVKDLRKKRMDIYQSLDGGKICQEIAQDLVETSQAIDKKDVSYKLAVGVSLNRSENHGYVILESSDKSLKRDVVMEAEEDREER